MCSWVSSRLAAEDITDVVLTVTPAGCSVVSVGFASDVTQDAVQALHTRLREVPIVFKFARKAPRASGSQLQGHDLDLGPGRQPSVMGQHS